MLPSVPVLTVVAGPNGSGKSTLTASLPNKSTIAIIDPDAIAKQLDPEQPQRAAMEAGRRAILNCRELIDKREGFLVETTLAGQGYFSLIENAKSTGYRFHLIYAALREEDMHVARVRLRVSRGGHDVPEAEIRRRYARSLANAPKAIRMADDARLYDNSGAELIPVMTLELGQLRWRARTLPGWAQAIAAEFE